jgi:hypothetical protein
MSLFENKSVCDKVLFFGHHIDPQTAGVDGVLSISNGHTSLPTLPDEKFTFTVDSENNALSLSAQAGKPSPLINCFSISPAGVFDFQGNKLTNAADPVNAQDVATKAYVDSHGGGGGGGWVGTATSPLNMSNFKIYNLPAGVAAQDAVNVSQLATVTQSKSVTASVASPPNPQFTSTTLYTFNTTGCVGNYYQLTFDNISGAVNTAGQGCNYDFYLSDTLNGSRDPTKGVLKYSTGIITNGNLFNSGPRTMVFRSTAAPTALYLNVIQTNSAQAGQITNLSFNCELLSSTVAVV